MGVDYYVCKRCGETFPDCGDYVSCENCGTCWCSYECAKSDGYIHDEIEFETDEDDYDYEIVDSCKFCREEDFDDITLLLKAMEICGLTREQLVERCKEDK